MPISSTAIFKSSFRNSAPWVSVHSMWKSPLMTIKGDFHIQCTDTQGGYKNAEFLKEDLKIVWRSAGVIVELKILEL